MPQVIRTFLVGAEAEIVAELIDDKAVEILGAEPDVRYRAAKTYSWSTEDVQQGRMHLRSEKPGTTMVRISVTTGPHADPDEILTEVAERLSHLLPERKSVERPAMIIEPHPGEPPEAETSEDQPL